MARAKVKPIPEVISIRKFADVIGCAESTVRKAIADGKLVDSIVKDAKGKTKGVCWEKGHLEWAKNYTHGNKTDGAAEGLAARSKSIGDINQSREVFEYYRAELARLEFEEKEKTLVRVADVRSQLFSFAAEVRVSLQAVPDVCVDEILSCTERQEAHQLMRKAINAALDKLTEVVERDFT